MTRRRRLTRAQKQMILDQQEWKCAITAEPLIPGTTAIEYDHIIPLAMGGRDEVDNLQAVLKSAHREKTSEDVAKIAKAKRVKAKHTGMETETSQPLPGSKRSPWKKRMDGTVVRRDQ